MISRIRHLFALVGLGNRWIGRQLAVPLVYGRKDRGVRLITHEAMAIELTVADALTLHRKLMNAIGDATGKPFVMLPWPPMTPKEN